MQAKNSHSNQKLTSSEDSSSEDESSFVFFATFPLVAFLATTGSFKDKTLKVLERRYTKYKNENTVINNHKTLTSSEEESSEDSSLLESALAGAFLAGTFLA